MSDPRAVPPVPSGSAGPAGSTAAGASAVATSVPAPSSGPRLDDPLPPSASVAPAPGLGEDWPKQATDAVVRVVDAVRDKTTGPAVNYAHAAKYGVVAVVLAIVLGILLTILLIRFCEIGLQQIGSTWDIAWLAEPIWIVYLLFGSVFSLVGLRLWRRANRPAKAA